MFLFFIFWFCIRMGLSCVVVICWQMMNHYILCLSVSRLKVVLCLCGCMGVIFFQRIISKNREGKSGFSGYRLCVDLIVQCALVKNWVFALEI
uniref:uncharacterized protein LOC105349728 isoform X2 n=1 Tax=Fragaria vesca subsp. vesca TaxID=101020 RepID=UPI0005C9FD93|nr:PREDICTED: uncharacterized protein LOC105349728 isoform X2 [Fragaria vesca subsp. vesca]